MPYPGPYVFLLPHRELTKEEDTPPIVYTTPAPLSPDLVSLCAKIIRVCAFTLGWAKDGFHSVKEIELNDPKGCTIWNVCMPFSVPVNVCLAAFEGDKAVMAFKATALAHCLAVSFHDLAADIVAASSPSVLLPLVDDMIAKVMSSIQITMTEATC
eukprot:PhF_6_TR3457/c0_g1_i3/m.5047